VRSASRQSVSRVLLLALALLLAGCGGATSAGQPTPGALARDTPVPAPTQPAPTAPTAAVPTREPTQAGASSILIAYHKSGGIAGVDETLTVYDDGALELQTRGGATRGQADPAAIQELHELLGSPEFAALQLGPPPIAPDQFVYELRVPGRRQPIVTADGADNPPVLEQAIDMLEKLKAAAR
jgi:hypothetical protein